MKQMYIQFNCIIVNYKDDCNEPKANNDTNVYFIYLLIRL